MHCLFKYLLIYLFIYLFSYLFEVINVHTDLWRKMRKYGSIINSVLGMMLKAAVVTYIETPLLHFPDRIGKNHKNLNRNGKPPKWNSK
jgi:hypothetical protein